MAGEKEKWENDKRRTMLKIRIFKMQIRLQILDPQSAIIGARILQAKKGPDISRSLTLIKILPSKHISDGDHLRVFLLCALQHPPDEHNNHFLAFLLKEGGKHSFLETSRF